MKTYIPKGLTFISNSIVRLFGIPKLYKVLWYRWLANGADFVDIISTTNKIGRKPDNWGKEWDATAASYLALAQKAITLTDTNAAKDYLLKASLYYHLAQWGTLDDNSRKIYYASCIRSFKDAIKYFPFSVELVTIQEAKQNYYGYLYTVSRNHLAKHPTILLIHGADSSKEEMYYFGKEAVENGFNLLVIDGPGQGEALLYNDIPMFPTSERVYQKALDYLTMHPLVDANNIGVFGISFGGYWSIKLAACDRRIKACVALGSPYSPAQNIKKAPPPIWKIFYQWQYLMKHALGHLQQTFVIAITVLLRLPGIFGAQTQTDLIKIASEFSLENIAAKVQAATLIINGDKDILCQPKDEMALYAKLQCTKELRLLEGMDHCCSKLIKISLRRQIMWWLKSKLSAATKLTLATDEVIL